MVEPTDPRLGVHSRTPRWAGLDEPKAHLRGELLTKGDVLEQELPPRTAD
jgi:hypothetical protein